MILDSERYQCEECGLHYRDRELAARCEAWCREHKSCNLEIIAHAEENRGGSDDSISAEK